MENAMNFDELLLNRRSIRKFSAEPIPTARILDLIQAATFAPSAGNEQPWRFVTVTDQGMLKRISDESKNNILARIQSNPDDYAQRYQKLLENDAFNVFYNAPCLVLILGDAGRKNIQLDCALAASYLMMAAADQGYGTCWVNLGAEIRDPDLKNELGIPENAAIVAPIILGVPETIPSPPRRKDPVIYGIVESDIRSRPDRKGNGTLRAITPELI